MKAFQDHYTEPFNHCYGCGNAHPNGLNIRSFWLDNNSDSDTAIAQFKPDPQFTGGFPEHVYGGLIAAILDCHGNGTASAAGYRHFGRAIGSAPILRYVTANLNINFHRPTPMGEVLELYAIIREVTDKKVVMDLKLYAADHLRVSGSMVSVLLPAPNTL